MIVCSMAVKNAPGILIEAAMNLQIVLSSIDILTIIILVMGCLSIYSVAVVHHSVVSDSL